MNRKTIVITGASRGIGRATALRLARESHNLILTNSKNKEDIQAVAEECRKAGADYVLTFTGDLKDPANVKRLYAQIAVTFGGSDWLINNAGISYVGLLQDMTDEEWNNVMSTNLSSAFYCCRAAIPYMLKTKQGKILNISSVWGEHGASCETAYCASKAGLNGLTRALAKELAPSGIQVNALALGTIDTSMNAHLSDEERAALEEEIPMGRYGSPEEAAEAVCALLQMPSYFTGQIVTMDGGWQ